MTEPPAKFFEDLAAAHARARSEAEASGWKVLGHELVFFPRGSASWWDLDGERLLVESAWDGEKDWIKVRAPDPEAYR